jgi:hypothetical protein
LIKTIIVKNAKSDAENRKDINEIDIFVYSACLLLL